VEQKMNENEPFRTSSCLPTFSVDDISIAINRTHSYENSHQNLNNYFKRTMTPTTTTTTTTLQVATSLVKIGQMTQLNT